MKVSTKKGFAFVYVNKKENLTSEENLKLKRDYPRIIK